MEGSPLVLKGKPLSTAPWWGGSPESLHHEMESQGVEKRPPTVQTSTKVFLMLLF